MSSSDQATFCATLVDEWVAQGMQHAVVAPGSRSTPMALALAARPELQVHVAHDERAAAFIAMGVGLASGAPAALLCTSGTAATHFHGAVVEAHLSGVPLLVMTADRPPELRDVGAPQTIDQTRLFGAAPRWFHDPGVADVAAAGSWRSLAQRSWAATVGVDPGPVHLNLPFREPLVGNAGPLPGRSDSPHATTLVGAPSPSVDDLAALAASVDAQRGVIVAGAGCADATDQIAALAAATGWPVLADARSGCRTLSAAVSTVDALLRNPEFAAAHTPEVVVRLGESPASKVLGQWLTGSAAVQVHVTPRPVVIDPDHVVRHRVVGPIGAVCSVLAAHLRGASGTPWAARWRRADDAALAVLDARLGSASSGGTPSPSARSAGRQPAGTTLTEPAVAHTLVRSLPEDSALVVASSMPVRDVEWYGGRFDGVRVLSNRGANGIDGVVSTGIGVAAATGRPTAVLLGDVALLHDSSALVALARRGLDLRIVVVDNDGGGIFSFLPQATTLPAERFEQLFGTPHGTDLVALAQAHGLPARTVTTVEELQAALAEPGPSLIRVPSDRPSNVAAHDALHAAISQTL
jgi:2-succinyl-5-enolpyruvyl-6-hydroxy-3-cyclohexene-1-carboxylate synthase